MNVIECYSQEQCYQKLLTLIFAGINIDTCSLVENKKTAMKGIKFEDPELFVMAKLIL